MSGPDQAASLEFDEFRNLVEMAGNIVTALGQEQKKFLPSEKVLHGILAKKIITIIEVKKGAQITKDMLRTVVTKQDGGILPDQFYNVVGSIANKNMDVNHILREGDFTIEE